MSLPDPINETNSVEERLALQARLGQLTTKELFAATFEGEYDDEAPWAAVTVLRLRGTSQVFEAATQYCQSDDPKARARGLDVLGQLGAGKPEEERPFIAESVSIAINHLNDSSPEVVHSAAWALAHLRTEPAAAALIGLKDHSNPDIRQAIAFCSELTNHAEGVSVPIALMEDENEGVRDWATFAVGSCELEIGGVFRVLNSPEIRAALHWRVNDTYEDARQEAIWGLARRKDPVGLKLLLQNLESESWSNGDEMAAAETLEATPDTSVEELCEGLQLLLAGR